MKFLARHPAYITSSTAAAAANTTVKLLQCLLNCLFSRTTWVSRYQKGKMQWHQQDNMQTICTSLQTDNHTNISSQFFADRVLFLTPTQQCQSTEGNPVSVILYFGQSHSGSKEVRRPSWLGQLVTYTLETTPVNSHPSVE